MNKTVTIIPPSESKPDTLRVAAYCRVSSDSSDQLHSYAAQIKAYTELISQHEGWELVGVYADEGLTGTRMDKREDFKRMMADRRKGKIDKVMVKSISRFARNTKDCLAALRELMRLGVTVQFEKENIDTRDAHHRIDGERLWFPGPAGIHLYLAKSTHELSAEDGTGGAHHLYRTLGLLAGRWKRLGDHTPRSRVDSMDICILSQWKQHDMDRRQNECAAYSHHLGSWDMA